MEKTNTVLSKDGLKAIDLVYISIGAALIAICSWINIPTAVPFTMQTFAVFLVLCVLGGERGTIATLVYVLLGAVGVPVFAGFAGGIGVLLGNTGGYIFGFILMGIIYIFMTRIFGNKNAVKITALVIGLIACYAFGTAWFMYVYMRNTGNAGLMTVLTWCVFPFVIPDIIKLVLAFAVSKRIIRSAV